ncbi:hypothetical protein Tco_0199778 [Tanacetum coccineum]
MLLVLILGYPRNDIDVFLEPLVDDLHTLFETGVDTYDVSTKDNFNLRVVVLWTINDYPALGTLCGCPYSGFKGCVVCGKDTNHVRLSASSKQSYVGHRRYLPYNHPFRKQKKAFNGQQEFLPALILMTKEQIYNEVQHIKNKWGKGKRTNNKASENQEDIRGRGGKIQKQKRNTTEEEGSSSQIAKLDKMATELVKLCWIPHAYGGLSLRRCKKVIKGHVRNRNKPEGCIAEETIAKETIKFFSEYHKSMETIGIPPDKHETDENEEGKPLSAGKSSEVSAELFQKAHLRHKQVLKTENPGKRIAFLENKHNKSFAKWLREEVEKELAINKESVSETVRWISYGPRATVVKYDAYNINGYSFHTKCHDGKVYQNSRVSVKAIDLHISKEVATTRQTYYYGVLQEIWVLDYRFRQIPLFKYDWVNYKSGGVKHDKLGYALVDLDNLGHKVDLFVLASQALQVFYVKDPVDKKLSIVFKTPPKNYKDTYDEVDEEFSIVIHHCNDNVLPLVDRRDLANESRDDYYRKDCRENIVVNLDSSSDNNNSDSYSTSQISTSEEIDYDSPEPPKSLLKWYHYLSDEYKDNGRFWGSKSGCNESDVKPSWKDIEKAKACMLAKAQASEAKVEACGSDDRRWAAKKASALVFYGPSTQGLLDAYGCDTIEEYLEWNYFPSIDNETTNMETTDKGNTDKDCIDDSNSAMSKGKYVPVCKKHNPNMYSPVPVTGCVLGLASVTTWDKIKKKIGARKSKNCVDKAKGKRKVSCGS